MALAKSRRADWRERLTEVINRYSATAFVWRTSDCLVMVNAAHVAQTGRALLPKGLNYKDAISAHRQLRQRGFKSLSEAIASKLREVPPAMAHVGDIGVFKNHDGTEACGIIVGATMVVRDLQVNIVHVDRALVSRAFRIGV